MPSPKQKQKFSSLLSLSIIIMAVGVCICYLVFMNKLSVDGFELSQLHQRLAAAEDKNSALEIKAMELQSYSQISKKLSQMNMVEAKQVDYILTSASFVAKK